MKRTGPILTRVAALVAVGLLAACGGPSTAGTSSVKATDSIVVGVAPDFFYTPFYFAVQKGMFAKEGIDAKLVEFPSGGEAVDGINAGQVDLTSNSPTTMVSLAGKNSPARAISSNSVAKGWFGVVGTGAAGKATDIGDLKGTTIAAPHKTILDMEVRGLFDAHKADMSGVDYQDVKAAQLVTGLARGDFDAVALWEPNVSKTLADVPGTSLVLDSDEVMPSYGYTVASKKIWSDQDLANRVHSALQSAIEYTKAHPDETLDLVKKNSGITDDKLARSIQDKIDFRLSFDQDDIAALQNAQTFMVEHGVVSTTQEQFDATYLPDVFNKWPGAHG